ncbi:MAG: hypothetical protein HC895_19650, partial [Leptolyngbyaceae cyanobacterium SM1_3_5]|nr:hypothetical protein [Leptolyngbyaceae cyanobacterium SM1_3_5]
MTFNWFNRQQNDSDAEKAQPEQAQQPQAQPETPESQPSSEPPPAKH